MEVINLQQAKKIEFDRLSLALGTFDGLHMGHMALVESAKRGAGQSAVLTFDALPADYFYGEYRPMRLMTLDEKIARFEKTGVDYLCVLHFDKKLAVIEHDRFITMLKETFSPSRLVVGYNYTYGREAKGTVETLKCAGEKYGFEVCVIPPVVAAGEPVSATRIRGCIETGNVERAAELLGYPYGLSGKVTSGRGIGSSRLGFPTANLTPPPEKIIPMRGVYGVRVDYSGQSFRGVCNIGLNPTVSDARQETIEIHILNLQEDLYGKTISVFFEKRIREEKKFDNMDALKRQIQMDIDSL